MSLNLFLRIKSLLFFFSGMALVFLTSYLLHIFGISLDLGGTVMARLSGACLAGIGLICWYLSYAEKSELRDGILLALFICDCTGFIVTLIGQLEGMGNSLGWLCIALWFVLSAGLFYFRFEKFHLEIIFLG